MGLELEVGGQGLRQGDVESQEGVMLLPRVRGGGPRVARGGRSSGLEGWDHAVTGRGSEMGPGMWWFRILGRPGVWY